MALIHRFPMIPNMVNLVTQDIINNIPTTNYNKVEMFANNGAYFNGNQQFLHFKKDLNHLKELTVSLWVNPINLKNIQSPFFCGENNSFNAMGFLLGGFGENNKGKKHPTAESFFYGNEFKSIHSLNTFNANNYPQNKLILLVGVINKNNTVTLYRNGNKIISQGVSALIKMAIDFYIGRMCPNNPLYDFHGFIQDLRIYDHAMNHQEVINLNLSGPNDIFFQGFSFLNKKGESFSFNNKEWVKTTDFNNYFPHVSNLQTLDNKVTIIKKQFYKNDSKIILVGNPQFQIITWKEYLKISNINNINLNLEISPSAICKIIVSIDEINWLSFYNEEWISINNNEKDIYNYGINHNELSIINKEQWCKLNTEKLKLSFLIGKQNIDDVLNINKIIINEN